MKQLTSRQICMMFCICVISLKFLVFPALLSRYAGHDAYISVFFGLMLDLIIIIAIALVIKKYPDISFKDILKNNLGKVTFYIIYALLFFYCVIKGLLAIKEIHHYFLEFLFDEFNWLWFSLPMLAFIFYSIFKGIRALGRTVELLFVFIALGVLITVIIPITDVHLSYVLPFFEDYGGVFNAIFKTAFGFADWIIFLVFMGDIKRDKSTSKRMILYTIGVYLFVILFFVIYVCLFRTTAVAKPYAFSDIPIYTELPSNSARIDWLSTIIWTITLILQASIMLNCSSRLLRDMIPKINITWRAIIIVGLVLAGMMGYYLNLAKLIDTITTNAFCIVAIIIQIVVPVSLVACAIIQRFKQDGREYDSNTQKISKKQ